MQKLQYVNKIIFNLLGELYFSLIGTCIFIFPVIYGQSIITDITRDDQENIVTIEYFNNSSKKLKLIKMEIYYTNGQMQIMEYYDNGKKTGNYQEYYENGKIKKEGQFKDGNAIGLWSVYYPNGKVKRMFYSGMNGMDGNINEWYENGEKKIKGLYKNGLKHGIWISWYPTGLKESMVTYNEGNKEGIFLSYYKNGNKKTEGVISYDGTIEERCWDEDGNLSDCSKK